MRFSHRDVPGKPGVRFASSVRQSPAQDVFTSSNAGSSRHEPGGLGMTTFRNIKLILLAGAAGAFAASLAFAQTPGKLKVGFMLPATGTFAALGTAIENGF